MSTYIETKVSGLLLLAVGLSIHVCTALPAQAQSNSAVVEVITEPAVSGSVRFSGTPDGQVTLPNDSISASGLTAGRYVSTISYVDPALLAANYQLTSVTCDDDTSASPSRGDVGNGSATFNLDAHETVNCLFKFTVVEADNGPGDGDDERGGGEDGGSDDGGSNDTDPGNVIGACTCPKEGAWNVANLAGKMACTGVMSMTMPLKASRETGHIIASNNCRTLTASGLSDDEATITFQRNADCNYTGTAGGSHEGIPMEIDFTLDVADQSNMSGKLHSVVSQQGMTCTMSRNYTLKHAN